MKATPEAVKSVIQSQGVDTLVAEDMATGEKVWFKQGAVAALCADIDELEANMLQPYRVRLSRSQVDGRKGARSDKDKPFAFVLYGQSGSGQARPVQQAQPAPVVTTTAPDVDLVREASANGVRNELLEAQLSELRARLAEYENADADTDDDDDDDAPEPVNGSAWNHPDVVKEILGIFKPLGQALGAKLAGGSIPAPAAPIQAASAPDAPLTDRERRELAAIRNFRAANGAEGEAMLAALLDQYAAETPNPATDGKE